LTVVNILEIGFVLISGLSVDIVPFESGKLAVVVPVKELEEGVGLSVSVSSGVRSVRIGS
jgi:hypothetical protein